MSDEKKRIPLAEARRVLRDYPDADMSAFFIHDEYGEECSADAIAHEEATKTARKLEAHEKLSLDVSVIPHIDGGFCVSLTGLPTGPSYGKQHETREAAEGEAREWGESIKALLKKRIPSTIDRKPNWEPKRERMVRITAVVATEPAGRRRFILGRSGQGIERVYTWHRESKGGPGLLVSEINWPPLEAERWLTLSFDRDSLPAAMRGAEIRIEDAP